jgi:hypothetical protein
MRLLFAALLALSAGVWLLPYPPFQDFTGHAAMLALRQRLGTSAFLQQYLEAGSLVGPYGVFLGLGHLLAPLLGPAGAIRVIGALANCALPCALLAAHRRLVGGREQWLGAGFLGLCLTLGHLNAQGLISFQLGLAGFVLAFARFVELMDEASRPRQLQLAALALATAFTHGFAFVLLLLAAALSAIVRRLCRDEASGAQPRAWKLAWVFLPALLLLLAVYLRDRGLYPPAPPEPLGLIALRTALGKFQLLFLITFFSRLGVDTAVAVGVWLLLGATAVHTLNQAAGLHAPASSARLPRQLVVVWTAALLIAIALVAPSRIDFFGSLDLRLLCTGVLTAILAMDPAAVSPRLARALRLAPPVLAVAMVGTLWTAALLFQREARPIEPLLGRIPAETRLLYLPTAPSSRFWAAEPFLHLGKRVLFERDVMVSNVWLHQGTALRAKAKSYALLTLTPRTTASGEVPWQRYDVASWDHVLVRNGRATPPPDPPPSLQLLASAGGWHLYRNDRATW